MGLRMRPAPGAHGDTARRGICDFRTFPAHRKTRISQIGRPVSAG
jgi:hypothetical protein